MSRHTPSSNKRQRKIEGLAEKPTVVDPPISKEVAVLAFYAIDHSAKSARRFYNLVVSILSTFNLTPTLCTIDRNNSEILWKTFRYVDKRLKADGFRGVNSMELSCMLPDTDDPGIYLLYAGWSYDKADDESTAFISIRKSMKLQMNWYSILSQLVAMLNPKYAIGHECDTAFNGMLFPSGMGNGSDTFPNEAMRRRKYSWQMGQSENVFLHGMIRDVFEWNCLNELQLSQSVGDLTLKEWIQEDATRGKLTPINDDLTFWEVDMKYESVIFDALLDADIIFDKERHLYWFDEGKKLEPAERIALKKKRRKEEFDRLVDEWGPEKTEKWLSDRGW